MRTEVARGLFHDPRREDDVDTVTRGFHWQGCEPNRASKADTCNGRDTISGTASSIPSRRCPRSDGTENRESVPTDRRKPLPRRPECGLRWNRKLLHRKKSLDNQPLVRCKRGCPRQGALSLG